jgi:RNA 3'-terminal phosphate cyclase (ATP)
MQLVGEIAGSTLDGAEHGSHTLEFTPGPNPIYPCSRPYTADPKTAGSTTLLLQVSLPCLLFSPLASPESTEVAELTLRGGTNASNAPAVDYTRHVFLPFLKRHLGLDISLDIRKRGYFPKGGGELHVRVPSIRGPLPSFDLTTPPGRVTRICGRAYVAGALPILVAKKMARAAHDALRAHASLKVAWPEIAIEEVKEDDAHAFGSGSGLFLWAETENGCVYGATALGEKRREPERVGKEAAYELLRAIDSGGCVDEYLQVCLVCGTRRTWRLTTAQDQIIILMVLAKGTSAVRTGELSLHTR